jgi:hypothetical protein
MDEKIREVLATGLIAVLMLLAIYYSMRKKESFVSEKAQKVYERSREVFEKGDATYSEYKSHIPEADPVLYTDVRGLWKERRLSPSAVQKAL